MMFRLYAQVVSALDGGAGVGQLSHVPEAEAIAHFIGDFGARRVQKGFKVAVARGIALGADADLVFALALMANVHKSRFGSRAVDMGFCLGGVGGELLYAACGPGGNDAVVSVLLGLGVSVDDPRPLVACQPGRREGTPLVRAVCSGRESTVWTLLRHGALPDIIVRHERLHYCGCDRKATALYIAVRARSRGMVKALLEHGACPSSICRIVGRCARCDRAGSVAVGPEHKFIQLSAWQLGDYEDRLFVLNALVSCERRCRCHVCSEESPERLEALRCGWTRSWEREVDELMDEITYDREREQLELVAIEPEWSDDMAQPDERIDSNSARRFTVLERVRIERPRASVIGMLRYVRSVNTSARRLTFLERVRIECNRARAVQLRAARRVRLGGAVSA